MSVINVKLFTRCYTLMLLMGKILIFLLEKIHIPQALLTNQITQSSQFHLKGLMVFTYKISYLYKI